MTVFNKVEHPFEDEITLARQPPMKSVTLILPLEAKTVNNPSDSSEVTAGAIAGAIVGVTARVLIKQDRATDSAMIAQC